MKKNIAIKQPTANELTKHTIKVLDTCGFEVWRQNNGGVFDPTKKVFRRNSATKGIPDVIGYHRKTGVFVCAEIKAGKDRLSEEQKLFLSNVIKAGGNAFTIRTIDDITILYEIFKLKVKRKL
jgi:hypothetical protein